MYAQSCQDFLLIIASIHTENHLYSYDCYAIVRVFSNANQEVENTNED